MQRANWPTALEQLDALEAVATAGTVKLCPICGHHGDHKWEDLAVREKDEGCQ
jgi:hypothetical protein